MRKYFQVTIIVGGFFILVFFKNLFRGQDERSVVNQPPIVPTPVPSQQTQPQNIMPAQTPMPMMQTRGMYKDGTYTGSVEDAYYGYIQVQVSISNGRISDVSFLQYPNDNGTSIYINSQAMPILKSEAIQAQSAQVDIVSGASDTSMAFQNSLANALSQAK